MISNESGTLMGSLGCALDELPAAVERLGAERDAHFKSLRAALQQLAVFVGCAVGFDRSFGGERCARRVVAFCAGRIRSCCWPLATEIAKNERNRGAAGFAGNPASWCLRSIPTAGKDLGAVLKNVSGSASRKGRRQQGFCAGEAGLTRGPLPPRWNLQ